MRLKMDLNGITTEIQIRRYTEPDYRIGNEYDYWCAVSYSLVSEPWLNYSRKNDEVFLSCEVDDLARVLDHFLSDHLSKQAELKFIEPDFSFELFPKENVRSNPRILYIQPNKELSDISLEWKVSFRYNGLTSNRLTLTLRRENIANLKNYLFLVMGERDGTDPEIVEMKKKGILC